MQLLAECGTAQPSLDTELVAAVKAADLEMAQKLLESLDTAELERVLKRGVDDAGRQLLHVSATQGDQAGSADIVRLLLELGAPVDDVDFGGDTPLSLALAAACCSESLGDGDSWAALDTLRVLLVAGARADASGKLSSPSCALAEGFMKGRHLDVCRLLHAFGAQLPWFEDSTSFQAEPAEPADDGTFEAQCEQESIPSERLGALGAKAVLAACMNWRQMTVKQLRSECNDVGIPTDGCVEKHEIISTLR